MKDFIIKGIGNLRSNLQKNAMTLASELYQEKRNYAAMAEFTTAVIPPLIAKTNFDKSFIRNQACKAMNNIV